MRLFRSALITGGSSGIGAAFAEALPAATNLILVARDAERLEAQARRVSLPGRHVSTLVADLATDEGRESVITQAAAEGIDLLINNVGIGQFGRFLDNGLAAERMTAEVNMITPLVLTRALLPSMIERAHEECRRAGVIIVASTAAFAPVPGLAVYAASKAFCLTFSEALSEELRHLPIDLLALCPGATRTGYVSGGWQPGRLPGALAPRQVAHEGLHYLGRRSVHVVGASGIALNPLAFGRHLLASGLGAAIQRLRP